MCKHGCKKIAYQLVKACLLLLGYENFTKELDIPNIRSLSFIQGLIKAMNRRVDWSNKVERDESLQMMEDAKNFFCNGVRHIIKKHSILNEVQASAFNIATGKFTILKDGNLLEADVCHIQFPLEIISSDIINELKNDVNYEKCRFGGIDASKFLIAICKGCCKVTLMLDLQLQLNYKKKGIMQYVHAKKYNK